MRILILFSCFIFLRSPIAQDIQQLSQIERINLIEQILYEENTELPTQADNIYIDQKIYVPKTAWVDDVIDFEPVSYREAGDDPSCVIAIGNQLKVRGFSSDAEFALVENLTQESGGGTPCHSGVMFFIDVKELATFDSRNKAILDKNKKRDNLIEQILFENTELPTQAGNISIDQEIYMLEFKWVDVVRDIEATYRGDIRSMLIAGEDRCLILEGNQLKVLGFSSDAARALVENLTDEGPGTPCPVGAMFFMDVEELESVSTEQI